MIKNKHQNKRLYGFSAYAVSSFLCLILSLFLLALPVQALTSDIARWYQSNEELSGGEIVAINTEQGDFVSSALAGNATRLLGVIVPINEALLSINQREDGVQVAIAGRTEAKVSMANGPISRGDLIGLSDAPGVGAKAFEGQPVVGVAEASFGDEGDQQSATETGRIPIVVSVGVAPSSLNSGSSSTTWIRSIAGRDVSALQMAFVFFIAAVGIISIAVLSYSSVRNGLSAVGRNPLARPAILRALSQSMIMVSLVAISSFSLMYFMLRL